MATSYTCISPGTTAADMGTAGVLSAGYMLALVVAFNFGNQASGASASLPRCCILACFQPVWSVFSRHQERLCHPCTVRTIVLASKGRACAVLRAEEDYINKPFRPVPMGLITVHGALVRSCAWFAVLAAAGIALHVAPFALLWIATATWYNFGSGDKHWFLKNQVFIFMACVEGLSPVWLIAQNNVWTESAIAWTAVVSVYEGVAVTVQVRPVTLTS